MEITFLYPKYLWAFLSIPLLIVLHFFTLRHIKGEAIKFANFSALSRITKAPIVTKNILVLLIRILVLSSMILAVAGTVYNYIGETSSFDFVLAIDTSSSMLANDFKPDRLTAAKNEAIEFINNLPKQSKVGIVSFAGTAFIELEPTTDHSLAKERINDLEILDVGGTDIGEAIVTSANLLKDSDNSKVVILLTDGQSNVGIDPENAIPYANSNQVSVYTIGIGTKEGGIIGNVTLPLKLDEDSLMTIANSTNAKYFRAENKNELNKAYKEISSYKNKKISINLSFYLIVSAIILSLLDWSLVNSRYLRIP
ncbi:VWA domain-containing protein [Candidatus Woesearchaeota archaeon]|nr:MAG: VWA domain-containing protein [Candidatus Woesearchaeota archaeon]